MPNIVRRYLEDFLQSLELEKGASERTIRNYRFYLLRFFDWTKIVSPGEITPERVKQFRLQLNRFENPRGGTLKRATQNYHLIALRAFLKYLAKVDVSAMSADKISLAKQEERQVSVLEPEELDRFLSAPLAHNETSVTAIRDKAILETLFSTGLRVSELAGLRRDQLNLKKDEHTVR